MNAVYTLWLRQIKKYFRSKSRIIGSLGQPVLFLVAFGFGLGPVFSAAGQGSYIDYLAPGIVAMTILFTAMFSGIEVIWDRQFGFLKETLVAPVSRFKVAFGRTLGGATTATFQGIVVLVISLLVGFRPASFLGLLAALVIMLAIAATFTAVGTAVASRMRDMQAFPIIMNFVMMPLFFLSGALFPVDGLPAALRTVLMANPLTYGVDALRTFLAGAGHFSIWLDLGVVAAILALSLWVSAALFEKIEA
jgi:ABC-2 type transport system permease protein